MSRGKGQGCVRTLMDPPFKYTYVKMILYSPYKDEYRPTRSHYYISITIVFIFPSGFESKIKRFPGP